MRHLIFFTPFRVGSHMLRSMLLGGGQVFDGGEFGRPGAYSAAKFLEHIALREKQALPGRIILTNVKIRPFMEFDDIADAIAKMGAPVMLLLRHDLLAMIASSVLAGLNRNWLKPNPRPIKLDLSHGTLMLNTALSIEQCKTALRRARIPWTELQYDELTNLDRVNGVIRLWAGQEIRLSAPTTVKMSPPLDQFVINIFDRKSWTLTVPTTR